MSTNFLSLILYCFFALVSITECFAEEKNLACPSLANLISLQEQYSTNETQFDYDLKHNKIDAKGCVFIQTSNHKEFRRLHAGDQQDYVCIADGERAECLWTKSKN